ncbi:n-acetylgalactosaminyl transferase [Cystoisospora suis]|uniref:N-acetylgalactosaminyl transferase n=1 Tax=Cystoisospora suis TaxID=483139 RepID=A0A2C6J7X2_9APIC|nr:n-acetylgalactosaminyl transferase [Cystoisospora suis]
MCMQINPRQSPEIPSLTWKPCDPTSLNQRWAWPPYPSLRYLPEEERRRRGKRGDQSHHEWEASVVRSKLFPSLCLDARRHPDHGSRLGISPCSQSTGSKKFFYTRKAAQIAVDVKTIGGDSLCLSYPNRLYICDETDKTVGVVVEHGQRIVWRHQKGTMGDSCLAVMATQSSPTVLQHEVRFVTCHPDSHAQLWITDW